MESATPPDYLARNDSLFGRLRAACGDDWTDYTRHAFVRGIADGTLPLESFQHYLRQDYLFLIHFARAYALAAFKSDNLEDLRNAARGVMKIVSTEMSLHVQFCTAWGLDEAAMAATPESHATMAYTRYVLERGMAGDLLELYAALAPCSIGYGEIGWALLADPATKREGNPYLPWIETYGGEHYQTNVAANSARNLDHLFATRGGENRFDGLVRTFRGATRLETNFWAMGLERLF